MEINDTKKDYCMPMHTTEHILNQTMIRMFSCQRSFNAHIEKKKSKCDYFLSQCPTQTQIDELTQKVNEQIDACLPISIQFMSHQEAAKIVDISKLPPHATNTLRIVHIGNYDACPCIGNHVTNTSQIEGHFHIISHDYTDGRWRVRFKVSPTKTAL